MSSGQSTEIGKCPRCHSRRCGGGGPYCGLTDEEVDAKIAQERAEAAAKVKEKHRLIDEEIARMMQDLALRRQASEQQQAAEKKQQTAVEKAKLEDDAKKVLTKIKKDCPGDGRACIFSQVKPGEPVHTDGICMFCDAGRLPKLAKTRNGKIELKRALNAFRNKDQDIYEAAKARLAVLPASALRALDDSYGNYCPGDGINECIFSSSKPGKMRAKSEGPCMWCDPEKMHEVFQNKKKLGAIVRSLKLFKAKSKETYDLAKARLPEEMKQIDEEARTAPRSAAAKRREALANTARRRLRTKTPACKALS